MSFLTVSSFYDVIDANENILSQLDGELDICIIFCVEVYIKFVILEISKV